MFDEKKKQIISFFVIVALISCIIFVPTLRNIVLTTFFIGYFLYKIDKYLNKYILLKINRNFPKKVSIIITTIIGILFVVVAALYIIPIIINNLNYLVENIYDFDTEKFVLSIDPKLLDIFNRFGVDKLLTSLAGSIGTFSIYISHVGLEFVMSFIIAFLALFEKQNLFSLSEELKNSKIDFLYKTFLYFVTSFVDAFSKVMKTQITISFINSMLSLIMLLILGFRAELLGLTIMIFLLGLIPVLGVIISTIPLSVIAFNIGGIEKVIAVIIMIIIIHLIEAYILNPKIMSHKMSLPICIIFPTLIISEQIIGPWGLIIGVPFLVFFLKAVDVEHKNIFAIKKKNNKKEKKDIKEKK